MGVICIVSWDYKPTYNWGGTTLYNLVIEHSYTGWGPPVM